MGAIGRSLGKPIILPVGDAAMVVRFATSLDDSANLRALAFSKAMEDDPITGVLEVVPSLVSVLVRYDAMMVDPLRLAGELSLRVGSPAEPATARTHDIFVQFGGPEGPDLAESSQLLGIGAEEFIERHNKQSVRILSTGFAPGFVYCGFHPADMVLPRRSEVRPLVPAGSVLFAAGQTAIAATDIPTGWHVIGRTTFRNFDATQMPPTQMQAGDLVRFHCV